MARQNDQAHYRHLLPPISLIKLDFQFRFRIEKVRRFNKKKTVIERM